MLFIEGRQNVYRNTAEKRIGTVSPAASGSGAGEF
jgi:hypothetical protein